MSQGGEKVNTELEGQLLVSISACENHQSLIFSLDGFQVTITTRHLVSHLSGIRHYEKEPKKPKGNQVGLFEDVHQSWLVRYRYICFRSNRLYMYLYVYMSLAKENMSSAKCKVHSPLRLTVRNQSSELS